MIKRLEFAVRILADFIQSQCSEDGCKFCRGKLGEERDDYEDRITEHNRMPKRDWHMKQP